MAISQTSERESAANTQIEPLLDEYQYAAITGRSVASARRDRLLRIGCPYVKLGNSVRYRPADVRAYIEGNLQGGVQRTISRRIRQGEGT
jgi:hypothetical protein